ncbi:MAG: hypothetical protein NTW25_10245 [Candidatus Kapabacteria bacterium]|nr:hypothetical protein [Candidatus Kapabacteria bacterium]
MDGPSTIRAIHKMNPEAKIIAVSGLMQNASIEEDVNIVFMHKPFTSEKLLNIVYDMLNG